MQAPIPLQPRDVRDLVDAIGGAAQHGGTLQVRGGGSKDGVGRIGGTTHCLELTGYSGVVDYAPSELVITARAGTLLADIESLVAAEGQMLAFEPMDYGPLSGAAAGHSTLGGVLAANSSGPRRIASGAARDHFLGFEAVSGRGELFKAGGRVVKNVTGYDLPKLMAGSWGTLAVLTEVTVKVMPRPRTAVTVLIAGLSDQAAAAAMSRAMGSTAEVTGAAHLPARLARRIPVSTLASAGMSMTALRVEGFGPSVAVRIEVLKDLFSTFGEIVVSDEDSTHTLWRFLRDAGPFTSDDRALWRVSLPPMNGWKIPAALDDIAADWFFDWAGGLVWLAVPCGDDAMAPVLHEAAQRLGGHATLVRAPPSVRNIVGSFPPQAAGLAALCQRVKSMFDPNDVLNPGRMATASHPA